jgi:hypothetical protein
MTEARNAVALGSQLPENGFLSCIFAVGTRYASTAKRLVLCLWTAFSHLHRARICSETAAIWGLRAKAHPKIRGTLIKTSFRHGTASFK